MTITISALRCSLQVALLGIITNNLRGVITSSSENKIDIFFYYEKEPSEEEKEDAEVVATEVSCDFIDVIVDVHKIVFPKFNRLPETGLWVFHKKENDNE